MTKKNRIHSPGCFVLIPLTAPVFYILMTHHPLVKLFSYKMLCVCRFYILNSRYKTTVRVQGEYHKRMITGWLKSCKITVIPSSHGRHCWLRKAVYHLTIQRPDVSRYSFMSLPLSCFIIRGYSLPFSQFYISFRIRCLV